MLKIHQRCGILIALLLFFLPAGAALAQGGEVPITTSSDEAKRLFLEGRAKFENIEFDAAAPLFDQAIAKDPDFALAHFYRAQSGGGTAVFQKHLSKAVELAPKASSGERIMILGVKANVDGDRATFKKHLDELFKSFPKDARVLNLMAQYYAGEGDTKASIEWYGKATEANPKFAMAQNALGYAYKVLGEYGEAEKAFKRYMEISPNSPNPADSYAELLLKMGRFDESIKYYGMAHEKDPSFTASFRGIGINRMHKGEFVMARESFEEQYKTSAQVNGKLDALAHIVYSYLHEWDIPGALKAADRYKMFAEKENPSSGVFANIMTAWIHLESGNPQAAKASVDAARKLNESLSISASAKATNEVNLNALECFISIRSKDLPGAQRQAEQYRKMVEKRNIPAEKRGLNFAMGDLECELGNHAKALEYLDQGPIDNPGVMFSKAMTYERMGDKAKASEWYKKAANWNWTGLQYALVRAKAMKKAM